MTDELAGWPSLERGIDPITGRRGSHQFLGDAANHHADQRPWGPRANRVQAGELPTVSGPAFNTNTATKANPLGNDGSASLEE